MKKRIVVLMVIIALIIPSAAMAYRHPVTGQFSTYTNSQYGVLTERLAARTGPGSGFGELGMQLKKGDWVKIISLTYDSGNRPWVQVEIEINGIPVRAYTGLKRFKDVRTENLFLDDIGRREGTWVRSACTPLYGPGSHYGRYHFSLKAYDEVYITGLENGYYQCEFKSPDGKPHRGWIAGDLVM